MPYSFDVTPSLVARLAARAHISEVQAQSILTALVEVLEQGQGITGGPLMSSLASRFVRDYHGIAGQLPSHLLSIPVTEREDGTIAIDTSGYSALTKMKNPKTSGRISKPGPIDPPSEPQGPQVPAPGGYPGPSVFVRLNDWMGKDYGLNEDALGRLLNVVGKTNI